MLSTARRAQQRAWCGMPRVGFASRGACGYDSPAMGDERRWAARYQFLEQLWRGRDRIICDRELEAALHAGVDGPLAELLAQLLPGNGGDARAWVALHNDRRAVSFARSRSGTVFAGLDEAGELASDEDWQVALINLDDGGTSEQLEALLEIVGERSEDREDCSVVLTIACGDDEDQSYEQLAGLVEELFGDARIYGLTRPAMAAFYDFGTVLEPEGEGEEPAEDEAKPEGEAQDAAERGEPTVPGIEVDNTLGTDAPRFEAFVAVIGARVPGEGVTFVELPSRHESAAPGRRGSSASAASSAEIEELAALRLQLAEAQRRGDMHAIERQSLLERLEQAEDRIASLDEELESREGTGESSSEQVASDGPRIDELLTREQSLRWELERVRGELENLRVRPVEELEAELVSTQAQLEQVEAALAEAETALAEDSEADGSIEGEFAESAARALAEAEPSPAQAREWMKARAKLDHLLRKLERGGEVSALELHRELSGLRRLL
jgi:hypothetical protein